MINLSRREFVRLVRQAYRQLPPHIRQVLDNLDVAVENRPAGQDLELAPDGGSLFGLYTGVPLPERGSSLPSLPDRIVIYRYPILRSCSSRAEVVREVRITLWHEVGHYLGLEEHDLRRLGYG